MCFNYIKKQTRQLLVNLLLTLIGLTLSNASIAEVFFKEDFEAGTINSDPNPKWSWKDGVSDANIESGMMFTDSGNDMYAVTNERAFNGQYALKLNFAGRNNWCNQCGSKEMAINTDDIAAGCIAISGGPWNSYLFNKSNGFSSWNITNTDNNQVCFNTTTARGDSLYETNGFTSGDLLRIPYQCGVNGNVGGRVNRRSDCNKSINYLNGVSTNDFGLGDTLSRRFYLYIPSATTLPGTTLKLGYSHYKGAGAVTLKLSVQRGLTIELTAPGGKVTDPYSIRKDTWYYFEEVFKRETTSGGNNGSYQLYIAPAGENVSAPLVMQSSVSYGDIIDMSVNGNFQHNNDASGAIYFDDVLISDSFAGPIGVKIPSPPQDLTVQ